jgi:hypothetical protein
VQIVVPQESESTRKQDGGSEDNDCGLKKNGRITPIERR